MIAIKEPEKAPIEGLEWKLRDCIIDFINEEGRTPDKMIFTPEVFEMIRNQEYIESASTFRISPLKFRIRGIEFRTEGYEAEMLPKRVLREAKKRIKDFKAILESGVRVYKTEDLPKRVLREVEEITLGMAYPVILCNSGVLRKFFNITAYNLEGDVEQLPYIP